MWSEPGSVTKAEPSGCTVLKVVVYIWAAATTLLVVKRCRGVTARLAGIAGEFTIQPLVVQGLKHPVNLGQHFLGRHWYSLDFATGCTQLGVWGQSVQLVGRLANRPPWAKKGMQPGEGKELPPPAGSLLQCESLPPVLVSSFGPTSTIDRNFVNA